MCGFRTWRQTPVIYPYNSRTWSVQPSLARVALVVVAVMSSGGGPSYLMRSVLILVSVWPLVWVAMLHGAGSNLFLRSFLLTRAELPTVSTCTDPPVGNGIGSDAASMGSYSHCWLGAKRSTDVVPDSGQQRRVTRGRGFQHLVLLVVDALRYDFVVPDATTAAACTPSSRTPESEPESESESGSASASPSMPSSSCPRWFGHLGTVTSMLRSRPEHARLYEARADPPTVTQQRLKALMGGAVPTFLDIRDNFASPELSEDNLLAQAAKLNRRCV